MHRVDNDFLIFSKLGLHSGAIVEYKPYRKENFIRSKLVCKEGRWRLIFLEKAPFGHNCDWYEGEIVLGTEIKNNCWYPEEGALFSLLEKSAMKNY